MKPENKLILGVDPGIRGALSLYDPIENDIVAIHDIPVRINQHLKHEIDLEALALTVDSFSQRVAFAVVEQNFARPGQGVVSMFSFGRSTGEINGILASHYLPIRFVIPSVWKSCLGLTTNKDLSRSRAISLFPQHQAQFQRKRDDGRAEATLLAVFGKRFLGKV